MFFAVSRTVAFAQLLPIIFQVTFPLLSLANSFPSVIPHEKRFTPTHNHLVGRDNSSIDALDACGRLFSYIQDGRGSERWLQFYVLIFCHRVPIHRLECL